jgi:hypothetical protein
MFHLLKKFGRNKMTKKQFIEHFFNLNDHDWIRKDEIIKRSFSILLNELNDQEIHFFTKNPVCFVPCEAKLSCAIGSTNQFKLILVFKELKTLLVSASYLHGVAILAHELGHLYYGHTENKINALDAQIEADYFAYKLGFGEELQEVLLDHVHSIDCRVRISKLTAELIKKET